MGFFDSDLTQGVRKLGEIIFVQYVQLGEIALLLVKLLWILKDSQLGKEYFYLTVINLRTYKSIPSMPGFLLSNVRSLRHKCDELHSVALNNNSAVVTVSETWLNDGIPDSVVTFPGYTIHRRDSKGGGGGGVALYVCNTIKQIRLTHLEEEEHEALWVWLRRSRLPRGLSCIIAAVLYLPRSSASAQPDLLTSQYFDSCLRCIECNYQQAAIVILGDTNKCQV